ncbi:ribonuclease E/G [Thermobrachium celere]|uniref:ribonuclease E/G n=1 Tax=Thermobrachium celere TaxID=53422 RepID=UPI0019412E90|nr:ribonuclease E/G [Thermobrachium celere]GFR36290.1 ribonuclease G [Thermobrachium celere]
MKKLLIDYNEIQNRAILLEDDQIQKIYIENELEEDICDNIYVGKVKGISNKMNVAFVDIGIKKEAILPLFSDYNLKINQDILVQVNRESKSNKGPRLKHNIQLKGRYLILQLNNNEVIISNKNKFLEHSNTTEFKGKYGCIIRSRTKKEDLKYAKEEYYKLCNLADDILNSYKYLKSPSLIYKSNSFLKNIYYELIDEDVFEIETNSEEVIKSLTQYEDLRNLIFKLDEKLFLKVDRLIDANLNRYIKLKSGGNIVVDFTEACTVIDVNSDESATRLDALQVNQEACSIIADYINRYDLTGNILIDFIDINRKQRLYLENAIRESFNKKNIDINIFGFSNLGILELSRKRFSKSFFEKYYLSDFKTKNIHTILREFEIYISKYNKNEHIFWINQHMFNEFYNLIFTKTKSLKEKYKCEIKVLPAKIESYKYLEKEDWKLAFNNLSIYELKEEGDFIQIKLKRC